MSYKQATKEDYRPSGLQVGNLGLIERPGAQILPVIRPDFVPVDEAAIAAAHNNGNAIPINERRVGLGGYFGPEIAVAGSRVPTNKFGEPLKIAAGVALATILGGYSSDTYAGDGLKRLLPDKVGSSLTWSLGNGDFLQDAQDATDAQAAAIATPLGIPASSIDIRTFRDEARAGKLFTPGMFAIWDIHPKFEFLAELSYGKGDVKSGGSVDIAQASGAPFRS